MIGRVGSDVFGLMLREGLQSLGVDVQAVRLTPDSSGVAVISVDERAENSIIIVPGANGQVGADDLEKLEAVLPGANALLLQLEVPLDAVVSAAWLAHAHGVLVILDPAPAMPLPAELYALVDILTPNESECSALVGFPVKELADVERAAEILLRRVKRVIIKLGSRGAYLHDGKKGCLLPGFHVATVDTTAAGDAFNGALAVALERELTLREAVRFANAAGALSATKAGAQPSMPARREVEEFLQAQTDND